MNTIIDLVREEPNEETIKRIESLVQPLQAILEKASYLFNAARDKRENYDKL